MSNKNLYWTSWVQQSADHRPVVFPPTKNILGWWCSGYDSNDLAILCAWILAIDETDVLTQVQENWPEVKSLSDFRFLDEKHQYSYSDRFKPSASSWIYDRLRPYALMVDYSDIDDSDYISSFKTEFNL